MAEGETHSTKHKTSPVEDRAWLSWDWYAREQDGGGCQFANRAVSSRFTLRKFDTVVLRVITTGRNNGTTCDHDRSKEWHYVWLRQVEKILLRVITTGRNSGHRSSPYSSCWNNKRVLLFTGTRWTLFGKDAYCNSTSRLLPQYTAVIFCSYS